VTTPPGIRTFRRFSSPPGARSLLPILLVLGFVLMPVALLAAPALAQDVLEGADDANRSADSPGECVRPSMPGGGDPSLEGALAYNDSRQLYEECLGRTEGNGGGPEGGSGQESGGSTGGTGSSSECRAPADDAPEGAQQAHENCLSGSGELEGDEMTSAAPTGSSDDGSGGILGIIIDGFIGIMNKVWDWTFGWALEAMAEAFQGELLSLPTFDGNGPVIGFYTGAVEKIRPIILVGILVLGILMMVRSDNYDLAYAGFQGLPKLVGIAIAFAFLPVFMGELARITAGISEAFGPSGGDLDAAGRELFEASIGNMAVANFLNLILLVAAVIVGGLLVVVAIMNKLLYAILFVGGAFALAASIVPSFQSLAGSWFRGVVASAGIPALWSIEAGIGSVVVTSPDAIFGPMTNSLGFISESAVTSIGAILTMWVMYKTPFKCIEWAFNVHLPGRGGLVGLARAGAALAVAIPLKTAVAQATRNLMNRSPSGSAPVPRTKTGGSKPGATKPGSKIGEGKGGAGRKIQQAQRQGQRSREAANVSKAHFKYARQRDRGQEGKERFMQGASQGHPREVDGPGLQNARPKKGSDSRQKRSR
jgi:hypothetical protein